MHVVLSIGSNISETKVVNAIEWLKCQMAEIQVSSIYETKAVKCGCRNYNNAVVSGIIDMDVDSFNGLLKEYEIASGRSEAARLIGDVPIDIDIVVSNGVVMRPWDYRQNFFRIGASELACTPV